MAKFKKGDRVRCIKPTSNGCLKGHIGTLIRDPEGNLSGGNIYLDTFKHCAGLGDYFELLTEYTPITPKVGERYRVLKGGLKYYSGYPADELVGQIITYLELYRGDYQIIKESGVEQTLSPSTFTTEYLELVEEPRYMKAEFDIEPVFTTRKPGQIIEADLKDISVTPEPIKKTIIQKTMNAFKKALLSADTKTLIKAGYMDDETLELTSKGQQALNFIVYEKYQKELIAAAEADIKEEEAKKK